MKDLQAQLDRFPDLLKRGQAPPGDRAPNPGPRLRGQAQAVPSGAWIPEPAASAETGSTPVGAVTLRHNSRLHHIKVGHRHAGRRVLMLVAGLDVRIVTEDGELIRELILDPSRDYQPMPSPQRGRMSGDT